MRRPGRPSCSRRCRIRVRWRASRSAGKAASASAVAALTFAASSRDRSSRRASHAGQDPDAARSVALGQRSRHTSMSRSSERCVWPSSHTSRSSRPRSLRIGAEQMDPNRRLAQAQRLAHLGRALLGDLAEREYRALPLRQLGDGCRDLATALTRQQPISGFGCGSTGSRGAISPFGDGTAATSAAGGRATFAGRGIRSPGSA